MKKKPFDLKNPVVIGIGGMIISLGIIFTFLGRVVDFIRSPSVLASEIGKTNERVDKWADVTQQLADQSKEQKIYNKAVADILKQQNSGEPEIIYSEDGKKYWNEEKKEWRPVKELEHP